ncbi:MAG: type I 3-dehydroquinate dehydratase, partial [Alistipes sp.]|nr:type I 3-dehydroquinate dehydratase [Alistipes sp.]
MNTNTITIRNITLGSGRPKICLPIVGRTINDIKDQAAAIMQNPVDIVEWRADLFEHTDRSAATDEAIRSIRGIIGDIPLLYTIRTAKEGGGFTLSFAEYAALLKQAAANPLIDAVDIEILSENTETITNLIASLKQNAAVIASSHDFEQTPDKKEIVSRLQYMETCGADVCKMAVMPRCVEDVLTLLSATDEAYRSMNKPIVTM